MYSITADFDLKSLTDLVNGEVDAWIEGLLDYVRTRGRELVDKARAKTRDDGGFGNITWNLRASIGMCIVNPNGEIIETYFPPISKGGHGNTVGRAMAESLAIYGRSRNVASIVFVAGENYASIVQAKDRDVIKHVIGDNLEAALKEILR